MADAQARKEAANAAVANESAEARRKKEWDNLIEQVVASLGPQDYYDASIRLPSRRRRVVHGMRDPPVSKL